VEDARRLLQSPPALMVVHPEMAGEFAKEEGIFRNGKRCALRDVLASVEALLPGYDLLRTYPVPGHPMPVFVFKRKG